MKSLKNTINGILSIIKRTKSQLTIDEVWIIISRLPNLKNDYNPDIGFDITSKNLPDKD